jgi:integrase
MPEKIPLTSPNLQHRKKSVYTWSVPDTVKNDILQFLDELGLGKVNKGKKIGEKTQAKYFYVLRAPLEYLQKACNEITLKDLEAFERDLSAGVLKSAKNKPYSYAMRVDMRIALRVFLKWRMGRKGDRLTDWFDCRDSPKTPDYLKEADVARLYRACHSNEHRFLIAVLFDGGMRAEEFHNIRYEDVHLPEGTDNFPKVTLRKEYSKTQGRMVSLYWKHSLEAVREYIRDRIQQGIKTGEPIFSGTYNSCRFMLQRLGQKVLGRHVHYHLFRHSSATYYACHMNRQQLCMRYGWRFSSNMPDVYIARAGVDTEQLNEKFASTTIEELKWQLDRKEHEDKLKSDRIKSLETQVGDMKRDLLTLAEVMALNPSLNELKTALRKRRASPSEFKAAEGPVLQTQ